MEGKRKVGGQIVDGSDIRELVENKEVFTNFVDHKFKVLHLDHDGNLSVKDLQPAVADIGASLSRLGFISSPDSRHAEALNEITHGEEKVSKSEFKEVLSDFLLGMAAGLKRDPIVILRIDGQDLLEYINSPSYEPEIVSIFSEIESPDATLRDQIVMALPKLGVDQGLPPASDSWVMSNIVEPALVSFFDGKTNLQAVTQETFLVECKKVLESIGERLKEQPVIVAHTENTYDGSAIKSLLTNKFETDKVLNSALQTIPRNENGSISRENLRVVLDSLASSVGLPPYGIVAEMDKVINDAFKMVDADDGKPVKEEELKKLLLEILGSMTVRLQGKPVSISINSVVHEPLSDPSSFLHELNG